MSLSLSRLLGEKGLTRKLNALGRKAPRIVKGALRNSAKRVRTAVVAATPVDTGKLKAAMGKAPIRVLPKGQYKGRTGIGIGLPLRSDLGIDPKSKSYYPAAVEYGTDRAPAKRFIRGTVDGMAQREFIAIGNDIAFGIKKAASS